MSASNPKQPSSDIGLGGEHHPSEVPAMSQRGTPPAAAVSQRGRRGGPACRPVGDTEPSRASRRARGGLVPRLTSDRDHGLKPGFVTSMASTAIGGQNLWRKVLLHIFSPKMLDLPLIWTHSISEDGAHLTYAIHLKFTTRDGWETKQILSF